ncbi:hypothetical protein ACWT_5071 [Actinoplanes sp. SE50]|uniref:DUF1028 domain-containing protein n=1 Tax=unclassified Actinoplanes TaxID=2626549 RepID=UPI00023ED0D2|nr:MULTISPECIES: DUF1028 domain-containing protein [unclassified Actinoplanes]AEV86088.1 hypothetical protein ACPL_5201 [Actinoplanes sp. SE50/110]ATO84486.1 hypothetical protein ACWT_5071 [Actinoplanes sp. SE50]SLM01896.1 uncharacterized protein ACSP50_5134 [Actinoplanes sp. SE50/110]
MTFSIVARSADMFGVAVASRFLGVGAAVPAALADVGAVATQSYANLAYRPQALTLLSTGVPAEHTVRALVAGDDGPVGHRQVGVVGASGPGATYTGPACHPWAGGTAGDGYAIQGNMLAGPAVVADMEDTWLRSTGEARLAHRLVTALRAGDQAGGDRRGRQSAALLVVAKGRGYAGTGDVLADLRVDDHPDPVTELARLLAVHTLYFERPDPTTLLPLTGSLAAEVADRLRGAGRTEPDLDEALASWAGIENLEMRIVPGSIDPLVLAHLRAAAAADQAASARRSEPPGGATGR